MRVPVLVMLPSQEPLQESAAAAVEHRPSRIPLEAARVPAGVEIDPTFAAVPVGTGVAREMAPANLAPGTSDRFVVRGYVDVSDPEEVPETADGKPVFVDLPIAPFLTCIGAPPVGDAAAVASALNATSMHQRGLDGTDVAVAILDTGINLLHLRAKLGFQPRFDAANSWPVPGGGPPPGSHQVGHGTMCAYDALIMAPNATLLDYPILTTQAPGGSFVGSTISVALRAFSDLINFWAVAFAAGGAGRYKALVVNNSWGIFHPSWDFPPGHPGRYIDNPNHPFQAIVSVLARTGADILFAAGNCGDSCPDGRCLNRTTGTIMGANASPDVLTLAGCDTNDSRVGYSSQGPSIAGMAQEKPDLTAYTHFLGSEAFGTGSPDSGTSTACPVAAGCVAAIRTGLPSATLPPANLFAQLKATARDVTGQPGWNGDYGFGIIDPDAAAQSAGV